MFFVRKIATIVDLMWLSYNIYNSISQLGELPTVDSNSQNSQ